MLDIHFSISPNNAVSEHTPLLTFHVGDLLCKYHPRNEAEAGSETFRIRQAATAYGIGITRHDVHLLSADAGASIESECWDTRIERLPARLCRIALALAPLIIHRGPPRTLKFLILNKLFKTFITSEGFSRK